VKSQESREGRRQKGRTHATPQRRSKLLTGERSLLLKDEQKKEDEKKTSCKNISTMEPRRAKVPTISIAGFALLRV
jgi:hypothetical protein